jgi:hypothetical protein
VSTKKKMIIFSMYLIIFFVAIFLRVSQIREEKNSNLPFTGMAYYGGGGGGATTTTTTTTLPVCNNNFVCELGETQDNCPNDCKTIVSMQPNVSLVPGQQVTITVEFYDSRYSAGKQVSYSLTIDGVAWNSANGCPLGDGTKLNPDISQQGYAKISRVCEIPVTATAGMHTLEAIPTIYW